jgi:hypothetical protein
MPPREPEDARIREARELWNRLAIECARLVNARPYRPRRIERMHRILERAERRYRRRIQKYRE